MLSQLTALSGPHGKPHFKNIFVLLANALLRVTKLPLPSRKQKYIKFNSEFDLEAAIHSTSLECVQQNMKKLSLKRLGERNG